MTDGQVTTQRAPRMIAGRHGRVKGVNLRSGLLQKASSSRYGIAIGTRRSFQLPSEHRLTSLIVA
jgi:hypothetical protein